MHKLTLLAALTLVGFTAPSLASSELIFEGSELIFEGGVHETTCSVTVKSGDNIYLPDVDADALQNDGDTAEGRDIIFILKGQKFNHNDELEEVYQCLKQQALVYFESSESVNEHHRLKNFGDDDGIRLSATNVDLELYDKNGAKIEIGQQSQLGSNAVWEKIKDNQAQLTYGVRYFATGLATPGVVRSWVTYSIVYQ